MIKAINNWLFKSKLVFTEESCDAREFSLRSKASIKGKLRSRARLAALKDEMTRRLRKGL
jgi:hypothetical protein